MSDHVLEKIEENLCDVLHGYAEDGIKSPTDVATVKHALSGMVKIKCLQEMEKHEGENGSASVGFRRFRSNGVKDKLQNLLQEADGNERQVIQDMLNRL